MQLSEHLLNDETVPRPDWVQVEQVERGAETILFKAKFSNWLDYNENLNAQKDFRSDYQILLDQIRKRAVDTKTEQERTEESASSVVVSTIFSPRKMEKKVEQIDEEEQSIEDSEDPEEGEFHQIEVGLLTSSKNFRRLDESEIGCFCESDCYVILHTC